MKAAYIAALSILAACSIGAHSSSVAYTKTTVCSVPVHVVTANLNNNSVKVTVVMPARGRGSAEPASKLVSRSSPRAALTGTFFDTKSLLPTGDIVINGVRAHKGSVGSALCVTKDNKAKIVPAKYRNHYDEGAFETVLAGGLTLVYDGKISLNPRAEGFSDPALFRYNRRTAVGVTKSNKLLMVSVTKRISLNKLAKIMKELGAYEAMLLDGGSSTAMFANGHFVCEPTSRLTNLLVVYDTVNAENNKKNTSQAQSANITAAKPNIEQTLR